MKKIIATIIYLISQSGLIYKISKKIVDYHRNENNCDISSNGEINFIYRNKEQFKTVFDVGANVGEWTTLVSEIIPTARIYSFEPSKKTFKILSKQKYNNNVSLHNIGLGDKNEDKYLFNYGDDSTLSSAFVRNFENKVTEEVKFQTLDSFCKKEGIDTISFLKIDTEGNEFSVLKGSEEYIKNGKIDFIQFEYGGTYINAQILLKDVFDFFEDKPYRIFKVMKNSLKEFPKYQEDLENFQYSNYVAVINRVTR